MLNTDLKGILPNFEQMPEVQRVILFGSRARGDANERSDIDLMIDAPFVDEVKWYDIANFVEEESHTLLLIECIWMQKASERLLEKAQGEGVILYERKNEAIH